MGNNRTWIGIGTDIVEINRMKLAKDFINRVLTENEKQILNKYPSESRKKTFLAGRWACKEAAIKALPIGYSFLDLEVKVSDDNHLIILVDKYGVDCSISHNNEHAIAFCMSYKLS